MADRTEEQHIIQTEPVDPRMLVATKLEGGAWRIVAPTPVFELRAGDADELGRLLLFGDHQE